MQRRFWRRSDATLDVVVSVVERSTMRRFRPGFGFWIEDLSVSLFRRVPMGEGKGEGNENSMRTKIISFLLATLVLISIHLAEAQQPRKSRG